MLSKYPEPLSLRLDTTTGGRANAYALFPYFILLPCSILSLPCCILVIFILLIRFLDIHGHFPPSLNYSFLNARRHPFALSLSFCPSPLPQRHSISWYYRTLPSVVHEPFVKIDNGLLLRDMSKSEPNPNQLRWPPPEIPKNPTDFVQGSSPLPLFTNPC
jgi:hypothetical protein